jgi:signal transduction histidine kinase
MAEVFPAKTGANEESIDSLKAEIRLLQKKYRKLERDHQSMMRNAKIAEDIASGSKAVLLQSQKALRSEIEERKATEVELEKLLTEIDVARQSRETFLSLLVQQLDAPLSGALGMLEIIASRPLDRTQKDLLELAKTSVKTVETLLQSAESISQNHRQESLGDETLRRLMTDVAKKD